MKKVALLLIILQFSLLSAAGFSNQTSPWPGSLSQDMTNIMSTDDGNCLLFSLNADYLLSRDNARFFIKGDVDFFTSERALFNGNITKAGISSWFKKRPVTLFLKTAFTKTPELDMKIGNLKLHQKGISNWYGMLGTELDSPVSLNPFVFIDTFSSESGSLYFFKSHFEGTPVKGAGIQAAYGNNTLSLAYGSSGLSIVDDEKDISLGNTELQFLNAHYSFSRNSGNWSFSSGSGYTGISACMHISLSPETQDFGFFQYLNYSLGGWANILSLSQKASYRKKSIILNTGVTGLFCFYSGFLGDLNWQLKDSFNNALLNMAAFFIPGIRSIAGSYGYTETEIRSLQYTGLILPKIECTCAYTASRCKLDFSVSKVFTIPFKIGNYGTTVIGKQPETGSTLSQLLNLDVSLTPEDIYGSLSWYLLSGLTLSTSIKY